MATETGEFGFSGFLSSMNLSADVLNTVFCEILDKAGAQSKSFYIQEKLDNVDPGLVHMPL